MELLQSGVNGMLLQLSPTSLSDDLERSVMVEQLNVDAKADSMVIVRPTI